MAELHPHPLWLSRLVAASPPQGASHSRSARDRFLTAASPAVITDAWIFPQMPDGPELTSTASQPAGR